MKAHFTKRKTQCTVAENGLDIEPNVLIHELNNQRAPVKRRSSLPQKYKCEWCNKGFTQSSNKCAHKQVCPLNPSQTSATETKPSNDEARVIDKLVSLLEHYRSSSPSIVNNIQNNVLQVNIAPMPNDFGKEEIEHILEDKPFLTNCVLKLGDGIRSLIEKIHFDPETPMNINLKNIKFKQKTIEVMKEGSWQLCNESNVLKDVINKGYKILYSHFLSELESDDFRDRQETIRDYYDRIGNTICGTKPYNEYWDLRKDVRVMIHNNTLYLLQKL
jgi:hypothetical protein